jgi:oligopeptide transport system ATP-binding protein
LNIDDLTVSFSRPNRSISAVRQVSLAVAARECVGVVGESGSGKTQAFMAAMGLLAGNATAHGSVLFEGGEILGAAAAQLNRIRGSKLSMIFQDPMTSLTPHLKIGAQLAEVLVCHAGTSWREARIAARRMLERVRVPEPERRLNQYPHELSGGLRQRVMIGMSLLCGPKLVIADEPTAALDVTVQAQILELLRDLNDETGAAIILITHNLGIVAGLCRRVLVMYAGEIVEEGPVEQIFESPQHPYTWSLLRSVPRIDSNRSQRLLSIEGLPPDLIDLPTGCKFNPRCPFRIERCFTDAPVIEDVAVAQKAACWVTMKRAYAEMDAGNIVDTSPGAASGVHPHGRRREPDVMAAAAEPVSD